MAKPEKIPAFSPYCTEDEADRIRAAFMNAGKPQEGDASVSDFIIRSALRESKRLERKFNGGKPWPPVKAGELRRGQRTKPEMQHRREEE